jgi:hypothetical protein
VEEIAKITYLALLRGQPKVLSEEDLLKTQSLYQNDYGQD